MATSNIFNLPTADDLTQLYKDTIQAESNGTINPNIGDYNYKAIAIGGFSAGIYADFSSGYKNYFPQYTQGQALTDWLEASSLPPLQPTTYATLTLQTNPPIAVGVTLTLTSGMELTDSTTGSKYLILENIIVDDTNYNTIKGISNVAGVGFNLNVNAQLNFEDIPLNSLGNPVPSLYVVSSTDGTEAETENEAQQRLLNAWQIPQSGSRITDYQLYTLDANQYLPNKIIVDSIVLNNNQFNNNPDFNFAIFAVGGSPINDSVLNKGLLPATTFEQFSRTIQDLTNTIAKIKQSIYVQQIINNKMWIDTVSTQIINFNIKIEVTLYNGFALSSNVPLADGTILTVEQLIKRETRRAICGQPYGANQEISINSNILSSNIPLSTIEQRLDYTLGTYEYNGIYTTILKDRRITVDIGSGFMYQNIPLQVGIPAPTTSTTNAPLEWIYDVNSYNNIIVALL